MPIGKNAIKRVINNGYSGVKTSAPDMENSTIEEIKKPEVKKNVAKNPIPKAVTSKTKGSSSGLNPAPKAAILEGMQRIPAVKKTPKADAAKETKKAAIAVEAKETATEEIEETLVEDIKETVLKEEIEAVEKEEISEASQKEAREEAEEVKEIPEPKKSMEKEPELAPVRTLEKITEKSERNGEGYTNLGGNLPYYLL